VQTSSRNGGGGALTRSDGTFAWVRSQFSHVDRKVIRWIAIGAIVIQVGSSVHYGPPGARQFYQTSVVSASLTRNIDHESDKTISYGLGLFIPYPPSWFREQAQFLREHHLSLFG
jgi:hypothetical protein